jgi:predicted nucleic acid-binding protein
VAVFVDANVLVYRRDTNQSAKHERAKAWMAWLWRHGDGRVSFQALQEFYVTATRKLDPPLDVAEARADVRLLLAWEPVSPDPELLEEAWRVQDRFGFSWWDASIVAAARRAGCTRLLTEDLQDGQDLDGLLVVDPFVHEPS